jgi:hypothetical protein
MSGARRERKTLLQIQRAALIGRRRGRRGQRPLPMRKQEIDPGAGKNALHSGVSEEAESGNVSQRNQVVGAEVCNISADRSRSPRRSDRTGLDVKAAEFLFGCRPPPEHQNIVPKACQSLANFSRRQAKTTRPQRCVGHPNYSGHAPSEPDKVSFASRRLVLQMSIERRSATRLLPYGKVLSI